MISCVHKNASSQILRNSDFARVLFISSFPEYTYVGLFNVSIYWDDTPREDEG
jgi:hypothetical protein